MVAPPAYLYLLKIFILILKEEKAVLKEQHQEKKMIFPRSSVAGSMKKLQGRH